MPVSTTHPSYDEKVLDWQLCRDTVAGQAAIFRRLLRYLPAPPGMQSNAGTSLSQFLTKRYTGDRYSFYASFAEFPEIVSPTLNAILGLIHEKKPEIRLPAKLAYLERQATPDGETLLELWERVTREIVITGRWLGLGEIMGDKLYACTYPVESMINWRTAPKSQGGAASLIVLRECLLIPGKDDPFTQIEQIQYRILTMDENGIYKVQVWVETGDGYTPLEMDEEGSTEVYPAMFGVAMPYIPIYPINALDVGFEYGPMPLLGLSRRATSIFRKTADYHRAIYMKCDPQPVLTGVDIDDAPTEIGGGKIWVFSNPDAKAIYLDIDGQGIPLMGAAIKEQYEQFADEAGMMFEGVSTGYESGEALRRRQAMRQVTIKSLVMNAAHGVETMLRSFAVLQGANPDEVSFQPNLDFTEPLMQGQELFNILQAKTLGAPMSLKSIYDLMRRRQLVHGDYEEELTNIKSEPTLVKTPPPGTQPAGSSNAGQSKTSK